MHKTILLLYYLAKWSWISSRIMKYKIIDYKIYSDEEMQAAGSKCRVDFGNGL